MKTKIFSVKTAASDYFRGQISEWTVRMWLSQGKIKKIKIGSRTFITEAELDRFVRGQNPNARIA
jgi:hypothetical protein